jgi:uncharacterized membrane protein YfcA
MLDGLRPMGIDGGVLEDVTTLGLIAAALGLTAAFAGLMAGLLGIGGGVIIVPALYYVEGLLGVPEAHRMHLAVGTSLAIIVVTSIASMGQHWRLKAVDKTLLKAYGPGVLIGVGIGAGLAAVVSGAVLTAVFAFCALVVAFNMATGQPAHKFGPALPGVAGSGALGLLTGVVSTLAGIGGGAMTVAILTLYSVPIHIAVGTASAVGILVSVPGALGFAGIGWAVTGLPPGSFGYVNLAALIVMAPLTAFMAPMGARLAYRLPSRGLARIFAGFLGLAALNMLWNLIT